MPSLRNGATRFGLGCLGMLMVGVGFYVISVLWWSIWLTVGVRASGAEMWSYWYTVFHWGLLCPFVAG